MVDRCVTKRKEDERHIENEADVLFADVRDNRVANQHAADNDVVAQEEVRQSRRQHPADSTERQIEEEEREDIWLQARVVRQQRRNQQDGGNEVHHVPQRSELVDRRNTDVSDQVDADQQADENRLAAVN